MVARPPFLNAWNQFKKVNVPVKAVGKIIGGKVQANTESGIFQNACTRSYGTLTVGEIAPAVLDPKLRPGPKTKVA